MASPLPPQLKKLLLIVVAMILSFAALAAVIEFNKARVTAEVAGANVSDKEATIDFGGDTVTIPAPEGYCFLNAEEELDRTAISIMESMQKNYGNHLWAVFANCEQLITVRATKNLNAYIDTGMVVTPLPFKATKMTAAVFTSSMHEQLKVLDPVVLEDLINETVQENLSPRTKVKSGQPLIYATEPDALYFSMTHQLTDPATQQGFALTEYDIVTSIKDHPLVLIMTFKDIQDQAAKEAYSKTYLSEVRTANQ